MARHNIGNHAVGLLQYFNYLFGLYIMALDIFLKIYIVFKEKFNIFSL